MQVYAAGDPGDIVISDAKGLISDIKLYPEKGKTVELGDQVALITYDGTNIKFTITNVPAGNYNRIGIKLTKTAPNVNDPEFGTSASESFSFIIHGIFNDKPFTYRSSETGSVIMNIDPVIVASGDEDLTVILDGDPECWFKCNGEVLSPNEPTNAARIDKNILKVLSKAHK